MSVTSSLNPAKALIFRITHRDNVPWILDHGLHCATSSLRDPSFVPIGSEEIIGKRANRQAPDPPGGSLADYVPFYFTPFSPMLLNIKTGLHGVVQRPMEEIVILVSSLHVLLGLGLQFFFTDRHAIYLATNFFSDLEDLDQVPWKQLQERDFRKDPEDPDRFERYQAEALVYQHVPLDALKGIVCYNEAVKTVIDTEVEDRGLELKTKAFVGWFFR
jgi:ssDNA thymidine ADP-ribosyltransferase, DarT